MAEYIKNSTVDYLKVSSQFIDKYIADADGTFVKVYLLGLRQCGENTMLTQKGIATVLDILESDVLRAWKYWESLGVVKLRQNENGEIAVSFCDLTSPTPKPTHTKPAKPSYSSSEINEYVDDHKEMKELLRHAEKSLGKTLSSNDQSTIFGLHDWLGLPVEVISLLISYCVSVNKRSMRSIELMAMDWSEHEIDSLKKAEQYLVVLQENNSKISGYRRAMGIYDRVLTKAEMAFLNDWAYKLGSPIELVKLAAEITAINTGAVKLPYMNTMLQEWYSKGIKSAADARAMRNEFKKQSAVCAPQSTKKNSFDNYSCKSEYDFSAIEQAALRFNKDNKK